MSKDGAGAGYGSDGEAVGESPISEEEGGGAGAPAGGATEPQGRKPK